MLKIRQRIIGRGINQSKREVIFPVIESIASAGIIVDGEPDTTLLTSGIKGNFNIGASMLNLVNGKRKDDTRENVIYQSDLNIWKLPPEKFLKPFIDEPFDLLINLADVNNDSVTYICAISKAKFKISYQPNGTIFDLVISLNEDNKMNIVNELFSVLKNLKPHTIN